MVHGRQGLYQGSAKEHLVLNSHIVISRYDSRGGWLRRGCVVLHLIFWSPPQTSPRKLPFSTFFGKNHVMLRHVTYKKNLLTYQRKGDKSRAQGVPFMKKMIALLALAFFGMTATCGMTFAAEANNGMATANEQAVQDPATHQQKKAPHAVKKQEKKNAQHANTKQQKKATKKHDNAASQQKKTSESQE